MSEPSLQKLYQTTDDPREALLLFLHYFGPAFERDICARFPGDAKRTRKYLCDLADWGCIAKNQSDAWAFVAWKLPPRRPWPAAMQQPIAFADDLVNAMRPRDAEALAEAPAPTTGGALDPDRTDSDRIVPQNPSSSGSDPNRSGPITNPVLEGGPGGTGHRPVAPGDPPGALGVLSDDRQYERRRLYDLIGWHEAHTGFARTVWEPGLRRIPLRQLKTALSDAREKKAPAPWLNVTFRTLMQTSP